MRRCLLAVHAHPDDEASKGASTVARYAAEGVHCVLVCCTGGEEGSILNPAMERPDVVERLHEVRLDELAEAARVIGYHEVVMLGYRDSGMPDTDANARADNFANAPIDEAVGRLVGILRRAQPEVVLTYGDDQRGYPHPDHLRVHDVSVLAFERAGDPDWYGDLGDPFQPSKLYYSVWSRARMLAVHQALIDKNGLSPFDEAWFERPDNDGRITTRIDVSDFQWARSGALKAHATQIDPEEAWWFGLDDDELNAVWRWEEWVLARSLVGPIPAHRTETDLFDGVRSSVTSDRQE